MIILTIRTDKPDAEIGLYAGHKRLAYKTWFAHRKLAETMHQSIEELLESQSKSWNDLNGVACYKGPGSFTGLRIGLTVANTLSYSLGIPIVSERADPWEAIAIARLLNGENETLSVPFYGSEAHITLPKN